MTTYGGRELRYAQPIADGLVADPAFRHWFVSRTTFADKADGIAVLADDMRARRSPKSKFWWRSHYSEKCRCAGCRGQETDLLAVFETRSGFRFAVHAEVKNPSDGFKAGGTQAESYRLRAACWLGAPPASVLPHDGAATLLVCAEASLPKFAIQRPHFDAVLTFEEIERRFPHIATWTARIDADLRPDMIRQPRTNPSPVSPGRNALNRPKEGNCDVRQRR
jgi:hypothetical protein